jgi:hypothetical protein
MSGVHSLRHLPDLFQPSSSHRNKYSIDESMSCILHARYSPICVNRPTTTTLNGRLRKFRRFRMHPFVPTWDRQILCYMNAILQRHDELNASRSRLEDNESIFRRDIQPLALTICTRSKSISNCPHTKTTIRCISLAPLLYFLLSLLAVTWHLPTSCAVVASRAIASSVRAVPRGLLGAR